jgi:ubiquinone/menaquinone biosynthesis C-methylase UbiE
MPLAALAFRVTMQAMWTPVLAFIRRALKPGGRFIVIEFERINGCHSAAHDRSRACR